MQNYSSAYLGVSLHRQTGLWKSYIYHQGKMISLGYYKDEEEAARARDRKAAELGYTLNFPTS